MPLFQIYRTGYDSHNNPESAGGPVKVAEIRARNETEALDKVFEEGVTSCPAERDAKG